MLAAELWALVREVVVAAEQAALALLLQPQSQNDARGHAAQAAREDVARDLGQPLCLHLQRRIRLASLPLLASGPG